MTPRRVFPLCLVLSPQEKTAAGLADLERRILELLREVTE